MRSLKLVEVVGRQAAIFPSLYRPKNRKWKVIDN